MLRISAMERQFSKDEDVFEASRLFLEEFCDPYLSDVDSAILAMYRASKELQKLRKQKEKVTEIALRVHEFENDINEEVKSGLKKKKKARLMKIRNITKKVGAGDK